MSNGLLHRIWGRFFINPNKPLQSPLSNPIDWILLKFFPIWSKKFHNWQMDRMVARTMANYSRQLVRIRAKFRQGKKIRVMFIACQPAKWKLASVYAALSADPHFEPYIGVSCATPTEGRLPREIAADQEKVIEWYKAQNYSCVSVYNSLRDSYSNLRQFAPDIVFYPESWYTHWKHHPYQVSFKALTCYVPYFTPNYQNLEIDCRLPIQRFYWRQVEFDEETCQIFSKAVQDRTMAGKFIALGHPALDGMSFAANETKQADQFTVIYAPHFTFNHPNNNCTMHLSTFTEFGHPILEYARKHPEFTWVFKPHPSLYLRLVETGAMTQKEADDYYGEWARIGKVMDSGDYAGLFANSSAMITDCGSFLTEYGITGHPLIHLISPKNKYRPAPTFARLYDTYYQVRDLDEMRHIFHVVLEKRSDPKRCNRIGALAGITGVLQNSGERIAGYLSRELMK